MSYFSSCNDKTLDKINGRKEGRDRCDHCLRAQTIMAGESQRQEHEAAGHMTYRKQRVTDAGAQLILFV